MDFLKSKFCLIRKRFFSANSAKRSSTEGFSIMELLVAAGLVGLIMTMTFAFTTDLMRLAEGERKKTEFVMDSNLAIQRLWPLISSMRPSMNNLLRADDSGSAQRNFFHYNTDSTVELSSGDDQKRVVTLDEEFETFDFLVDDGARGTPTLYNPAYAYNPSSFWSGSLSFVGINNFDYLTEKLHTNPAPKEDLLVSGKLLLFQSPVFLRDVASLSDSNYNKPEYIDQIPRNFSFLGHWKSGGNIFLKNDFESQFIFKHPLLPALNVQDIDTYFRYLPPSLAGGNFTTVAPVTGYRLTVRKSSADLSGKLRDVHLLKWDPALAAFPAGSKTSSLSESSVILRRITALKLIRDHISNPIIRIEVLQ